MSAATSRLRGSATLLAFARRQETDQELLPHGDLNRFWCSKVETRLLSRTLDKLGRLDLFLPI